ncbi:MAG: 5-formyltetrahydrofolate cyclo-ligase [Alphaproteobacteria bacterium]
MATVAPPSFDDPELARLKRELRRRARAVRAAVPAPLRQAAGARLRVHLTAWLRRRRGAAVAGFWPLGGEVDLKPLLQSWHAQGGTALLPRMQGPGRPLRFLRWTPDTPLEPAAFDVEEPPAGAPEHRPDVVLVPLLAVDAAGYRLGYGGGFYDRTLAALGAVDAVGVALDVQRVDAVPRGVHDRPLSHLVTESGVMSFSRGRSR